MTAGTGTTARSAAGAEHSARPGSVHRTLDILEVVESSGGSLSDVLTGSRWRLALPGDADLRGLVQEFLARDEVLVERMTKKGLREFDARAAVVSLVCQERDAAEGEAGPEGGPETVLDLVLKHTVPAVRPDDVLAAMAKVGELPEGVVPRLTRMEQGPLDEENGTVGDPLHPST